MSIITIAAYFGFLLRCLGFLNDLSKWTFSLFCGTLLEFHRTLLQSPMTAWWSTEGVVSAIYRTHVSNDVCLCKDLWCVNGSGNTFCIFVPLYLSECFGCSWSQVMEKYWWLSTISVRLNTFQEEHHYFDYGLVKESWLFDHLQISTVRHYRMP